MTIEGNEVRDNLLENFEMGSLSTKGRILLAHLELVSRNEGKSIADVAENKAEHKSLLLVRNYLERLGYIVRGEYDEIREGPDVEAQKAVMPHYAQWASDRVQEDEKVRDKDWMEKNILYEFNIDKEQGYGLSPD